MYRAPKKIFGFESFGKKGLRVMAYSLKFLCKHGVVR